MENSPSQEMVKSDCFINEIIIKRKMNANEILAYRVFLFLKDFNKSGSGWIEKKIIKKIVPEFFGKDITYNFLSKLEELYPYVEVHKHAVRVKGWKAARNYHNATYVQTVMIPKACLIRKDLFLAHIYSAWIDDKTISREKIEELTSIPKSTQISWEKKAGVQKRTNVQVMTEEEYLENQDIPTKDGKVVGVYYKDGLLYRQLPNSYYSTATKRTHNKARYLDFLRRINGDKVNGRTENYGPLFVDDRFFANGKITVHRTNTRTSFFEIESTNNVTYWQQNPFGYTY